MRRSRYVAGFGCVTLLVALAYWLQPPLPVDDPKWRGDYDHQFRKHAKHYFGVTTDWRWFRAQGIVESRLRPHARSRRGAVGLMQMLPSTFEEVWRDHSLLPDIHEARWNVAAGIAYGRYLYDRWRPRLPALQWLPFTLASYNAGHSRISKALQLARMSADGDTNWNRVAPHAPEETRNYVARVRALMGERG